MPLALAQPSSLPAGELGPRAGSGTRSGAIALAAGALASACVLLSGLEAPLPTLGWAAAFLFVAVERDVRDGRIPNWLTLPAFGLCVAHAAMAGGLDGVSAALRGAGTAFALLLLPYAAGGLGAGDVKVMMVLGALWGGRVTLALAAWAILCGGVLSLAWVTLRGELADLLLRWAETFRRSLVARRWNPLAAPRGSAADRGIPFAVAIACATAAFQLWGAPWP